MRCSVPTLDETMACYGSDKSSAPSEPWMWGQDYCRRTYQGLFGPLRNRRLTLLELGWGEYDPERGDHSNPDNGGRSARAWSDYFRNGQIVAVDLAAKNFRDAEQYPRVHLYDRTDQTDPEALGRIHDAHGDFDIIIDDASHVSSLTIASFQLLWPWLKPGGLYVIEDLHSSYHDYYFGRDEAHRDPGQHGRTAMDFFKRIADEAFFSGRRMKGPAVDDDPYSWDVYPRRHWLGYAVEEVRFCAPQLIVVRKRTLDQFPPDTPDVPADWLPA